MGFNSGFKGLTFLRCTQIILNTLFLFQLDTLLFSVTFTIFFLQFSLHISDRLVHHQENQITRAASGTFPSFVVISCVAVGANVNVKENKSLSSWKRNKVFTNDARSTKHKDKLS